MPRHVDLEQRRADILHAAMTLISESGYRGLTNKAIAERMGGSTTLVTHYFPTRDLLVEALIESVLDEIEVAHQELARIDDPHERIQVVLGWFLVVDEDDAEAERLRIALLPYRDGEPALRDFFTRYEQMTRALLRTGVEPFVPADDIDVIVSMVRAWVNGIALSVTEHPDLWPEARQREVMERFFATIEHNAAMRP